MKGVKAILLASGSGRRFDASLPKQFHILGNKPVYQHTIDQFVQSELFEEIIIVCHPDWMDQVQSNVTIVPGGTTRQESTYLGLLAAGAETEIVLIHDAVRPFVTEKILRENIEMARVYGACDTCIPSADTLVVTKDSRKIEAIPSRSNFLRGQTPQTFSYPLILKAHEQAQAKDATDDCQLILTLGHSVHIIKGDEINIKITTPFDLQVAESLLQAKKVNFTLQK